MGIRSFKDLDVYQKAYIASVELHKRTLEFPKIEQYALADQIRRASKSICANIAEGFAKQYDSNAEYKRYILIGLGSANEMLVWLDYAETLGYLDNAAEFRDEYCSICRMLKALHKSRSTLDGA